MNNIDFKEMSKNEQHQILAEILSQIATYEVVENIVDKKGSEDVFTYVVPDFNEDEMDEFKRELDDMGFKTEIEDIDDELNLLIYPNRGIPPEAFELYDDGTEENSENDENEMDDEEIENEKINNEMKNEENNNQYESINDSEYFVSGLFEDEEDTSDLKFPDDFAEEKDDKDAEDDVDVIDGEAVEKGDEDDEGLDDLFGDEEDNLFNDDEIEPIGSNDLEEPEDLENQDEFNLEAPMGNEVNMNINNTPVDSEEAKMVKSQLINIKKSVEELLDSIKPGQDMEPWVQAKLTLAQDYLQTVKNNLLDREEEIEEPMDAPMDMETSNSRAKFMKEGFNNFEDEDYNNDSPSYEDDEDESDEDEGDEDEGDEETEENFDDYSVASYKFDKFMPEEVEVQDEYYEILDDEEMDDEEKIEVLAEFIEDNCTDEERMYSYFPKDGSVEEFARYLVEK